MKYEWTGWLWSRGKSLVLRRITLRSDDPAWETPPPASHLYGPHRDMPGPDAQAKAAGRRKRRAMSYSAHMRHLLRKRLGISRRRARLWARLEQR